MSSEATESSTIWNFFDLCPNSDKIALCKICKKELSYKSTSNNLRKHVQRKHSDVKLVQGTNKIENKIKRKRKSESIEAKEESEAIKIYWEEEGRNWELQEGMELTETAVASTSAYSPSTPRGQKRAATEAATEGLQELMKEMRKSISKISGGTDQWDTFGEYIISEIRNLKDDRSRQKVKRGIIRIIENVQDEEDGNV